MRDILEEHSKNVELVVKGEDTELDKVIDVIGEPLLHLIRNAVDHGIESTEGASGKAGNGNTSTLNAYQGRSQIFVE